MVSADFEGMRTSSFIPRPDAESYNVVAYFPDPSEAARAIRLLHERGLADTDVQLLGSAEDALQPGSILTENDLKVTKSTVHDAAVGLGIGAMIGAALGVVVLLVPPVHGAVAPVDAGGYGLAAVIGAIFGSGAGVLVGGVLGLDQRRAGTRTDAYTLDIAGGLTLIGVRAEQGAAIDSATHALHDCGALKVEIIPAGGHLQI